MKYPLDPFVLDALVRLQKDALAIFGRYDLSKSLLWLVEEVGELTQAIRKQKSKDEIAGEIADLAVWVICLCNILDVELSECVKSAFKKEIRRQISVYGRMKYSEMNEEYCGCALNDLPAPTQCIADPKMLPESDSIK